MIVGKLENRGTVCQHEIACLNRGKEARAASYPLGQIWRRAPGSGGGACPCNRGTESQMCPTVREHSREFAKNRLGSEK